MTAWTDERTESLKQMWADGLTASQITKQLGGVSRSAVVSKAHRSGCSPRKTGRRPDQPRGASESRRLPDRVARPAARRAAPRVPPAPRPLTEKLPTRAAVCVEVPGLATAATLAAHMCKWPIGDPSGDHFTFCGRHQARGPYCDEHAQVAYGPPSEKAKANRSVARKLGYRDLFATA